MLVSITEWPVVQKSHFICWVVMKQICYDSAVALLPKYRTVPWSPPYYSRFREGKIVESVWVKVSPHLRHFFLLRICSWLCVSPLSVALEEIRHEWQRPKQKQSMILRSKLGKVWILVWQWERKPTRCNRCLFLTISQHVSGIIMPIFRRTRRMLLHVVCCAGSAGCGW